MHYAYDLSIQHELKEKLKGIVASVRTPFNEDGSIDYRSLGTFVDRSIAEGAAAIVLTRGDSLYTILSDQEIAELTQKTVKLVDHRVPVIAADKQWWTQQSLAFATFCRETGADLLMISNPDWGNSATIDSIVEHYNAISAEMPVMVLTASFKERPVSFGLEVIRKLRDTAPGVMAVKDDHPSGAFGRRVCSTVSDRWVVMMGGTYEYYLEKYHYGCDCTFSSMLAFRPDLAREFYRSLSGGDYQRVIEIIERYEMPFFELISTFHGGFSAGIAAALELQGVQKRFRRPPYAHATDEEVEKLRELLQHLG